MIGCEMLLERVGVREDLVEVEPSGILIRLVGDECETARLRAVRPGQLDGQGTEFFCTAGLGLKDCQQRPGLAPIDVEANDYAAGVLERRRQFSTHSVTRVPGSTMRTAVVGARSLADFSKFCGSVSFFVSRRSPSHPLVNAKWWGMTSFGFNVAVSSAASWAFITTCMSPRGRMHRPLVGRRARSMAPKRSGSSASSGMTMVSPAK